MGWEPGDPAAGDDKYRAHSWRRNGGRRITERPLSLERVQGTCQEKEQSKTLRRGAFTNDDDGDWLVAMARECVWMKIRGVSGACGLKERRAEK